MKKTKKVNPKDTLKATIKNEIREKLGTIGIIEDGSDYGFTKDTLVLHSDTYDVQIKLVTPKSGVDRYEKLEED